MQKENRFSIGEISKLTGVTIRTLQYYDNIGILPLEKESTNGRRYYGESDLAGLQQILFYKSLGLKINDIKKLLEETVTEQQLISVLEKQRDILYHKLNDLRSNIACVETSLESLKENKSLPLGNLIQLIISLNKETIFEYEKVLIQYINDEEINVHKLDMKNIGTVAKENNIAIYELSKIKPSLEELFLELTVGKADYVSSMEKKGRKGDRK